MMHMRTIGFLALATLGGLLPWAAAAPLPADDDDKPSEEAEDEEQEAYFAVVGGDVYPEGGGVLRRAMLLAKDGVIEEIGYDLELPKGTRVIDVSGLRVYPGLVAYDATSRVVKGSVPRMFDEDDVEDVTEEIPEEENLAAITRAADRMGFSSDTAAEGARDLGDDFDPFSTDLVFALSAGITTVGQSSKPVKLKRYELDVDMDARGLVSLSYSTASARRQARERFSGAATYLREYRLWEERVKDDKELSEPSDKGVHKPTLEILQGTKRAKFGASNRDDLLGIARLAQQYDFRPVIEGCTEGWTVADELGRAGAFAVVTPRERRARDEELVREGGSSIENGARLHAAGVQVAVIPANKTIDLGGIAGRDLLHLPIEAAFAVRGGLSESSAFDAITIIPARVLGVDHRVGSLAAGKDCDLMITDGDPLHYETFVQYTVVEGRLVYDKAREGMFGHIRPRADGRTWVEGEEPEEPAADAVDEEKDADKDADEDAEKDAPEDAPEDKDAGSEEAADKDGDSDAS